LAAGVLAMILANTPAAEPVAQFWDTRWSFGAGRFTLRGDLRELVNDGLMSVFFFVAGLEIKREMIKGQLSSLKRAAFPVFAALGGMIAPALLYLGLSLGGAGVRGWGIPMATDIAFSIGVLSLLGRRVPPSARTFLLALAIADDIGAIVVIAVFYSSELHFDPMFVAAAIWVTIMAMNEYGVRSSPIKLVASLAFWASVRASGIHPTIAGVILGVSTPIRPWFDIEASSVWTRRLALKLAGAVAANRINRAEAILGKIEVLSRETESPLDRQLRRFHPWSSWVILPMFALANAGVSLSWSSLGQAARSAITWGIIVGLMLGKPLGIVSFAWMASRLGWASAPRGLDFRSVVGVGIVAGIGFTVSLFIADLAFDAPHQVVEAKLGVLAASVSAGALGYAFLRLATDGTRMKHGSEGKGEFKRPVV